MEKEKTLGVEKFKSVGDSKVRDGINCELTFTSLLCTLFMYVNWSQNNARS